MRGGHRMAAYGRIWGAAANEKPRRAQEDRRGGACAWRLGRDGRASARAERESRFQMDTTLARGLARSAARACEREACRGRAGGEGRVGLGPGEAAGVGRGLSAAAFRCRSEAGSSDAPRREARRDGDQPAERRQGVARRRGRRRGAPSRSVGAGRRLMLQFAPGVKVYLACKPVDMRRGFDGLAAGVAQTLRADPYSGAAFVFRSKRGDYVKILTWDGSGLCLFAKRLEKGRFVWPPIVEGALHLTSAQLALLIEGIDWRKTLAPEDPEHPSFLLIPPVHGFAGGYIVIAVNMSRSVADLPEDPAELRRFAAALAAEVHSKTLLIEKLRMQLAVLRRARFGRSSEKLDREIEHLELLLGDIEESDAERQARTEAPDGEASSALPSKKPSVRTPLPDHLPLETVMPRSALRLPDLRRDKVRPDRRR